MIGCAPNILAPPHECKCTYTLTIGLGVLHLLFATLSPERCQIHQLSLGGSIFRNKIRKSQILWNIQRNYHNVTRYRTDAMSTHGRVIGIIFIFKLTLSI